MNRVAVSVSFCILLLAGAQSCSGDKGESRVDTTHDTITGTPETSDSSRFRFQRLVSAMPVPFDILKDFSGAKLPYHGELLNSPENVALYPDAQTQAINLGVYGADVAYMISQNKLAESAPYLKGIRRLSDNVVAPTVFDAGVMDQFEKYKDDKDSLQKLMNSSFDRIDSTLQGNERFVLATLVIYGAWIESLYLTTQHIGDEQQNEKNKVLFDMLAMQQPYLENITALLASFPEDSTCAWLHRETVSMSDSFPTNKLTPEKFSEQLKQLRDAIAVTRNKLVRVP